MPHYVRQGEIPRKRHTLLRDAQGLMRYEEHVSRKGFSDIYSNLYHLSMPTRVARVGEFHSDELMPAPASISHRARHLRTGNLDSSGDAVLSRRLLFYNQDLRISKAHAHESMACLYRNGHHDELFYVQSGAGTLRTNFGNLNLADGDYVVIPRGVIYQVIVKQALRLLVVESKGAIETPARYRNAHGQLLEHSPFCERDIRVPSLGEPDHRQGEFDVRVRLSHGVQHYVYANHPFDLVGWDGFYYPWALNIRDFEPITGSIHQPPPVHQTFQAPGFVVCSFVSRLFDYHPDAIPAPYPHSNVDSDEIIFYSWGNFMSRKGIEPESITLHPMGLPHGPQPGKYEESIGKKATQELAVMIDTFEPLIVAAPSMSIDDPDYAKSWL
jgi:homogentisate 1,2-dioxygenase